MNKNDTLLSPIFIRLFIPFGIAHFMSVLLGSANAVMSPILTATFSLTPADLGFMTSVYLISFGMAQFPLGVFLDRYGARNTLAPFLLLAAAGAVIFSLSQNMTHLIISRATLGVGMSGCLMSAFKAYTECLPKEKLPLAFGAQCLTGGLGGIFATKPVLFAINLMPWRTFFLLLAAMTLIAGALIWVVIPPQKNKSQAYSQSFLTLLIQMFKFLGDPRFIYIAPVAIMGQSVMFAYLYLWIGPWMRDVAGMSVSRGGGFMLAAGIGAAAGYFLNGLLADIFRKKHILSDEKIYFFSGAILTSLTAVIALVNSAAVAWLWGIVMFFTTMVMISFALTRNLFAAEEAGRALSLLNFAIFFASFIAQWFIGIILNRYPVENGSFSAAGHQTALTVIVLLNLAASVHLYFGLRKRGKI